MSVRDSRLARWLSSLRLAWAARRGVAADDTLLYLAAFRALARFGVGRPARDADRTLLAQAVSTSRGDDRDALDTVMFGAVRALERAEEWRMVAGTWEHIGDRVGLGAEAPRLLDRYSLPLEQWNDPRADDDPRKYYRGDDAARRLHRRAWAYAHAAEEASANRRFMLATRLYRKTGLAWVVSAWGDRSPAQAACEWNAERLSARRGAKWEEAGKAFARAALLSIQARLNDEKIGEAFDAYTPEDVRWRGWFNKSGADYFAGRHSDRERLVECFERLGECHVRKAEKGEGEEPRARAYEKAVEQLEAIRDALKRAGRRAEAIAVYLEIDRLRTRCDCLRATSPDTTAPSGGKKLKRAVAARLRQAVAAVRFARRKLYRWTTGSGTSILRTLVTVTAIYVLLLPGGIILLHLVERPTTDGVQRAAHAAARGRVVDDAGSALLFSAASAVNQAPSGLEPHTDGGRVLQVVGGLLGYFALGFSLWVITREVGD